MILTVLLLALNIDGEGHLIAGSQTFDGPASLEQCKVIPDQGSQMVYFTCQYEEGAALVTPYTLTVVKTADINAVEPCTWTLPAGTLIDEITFDRARWAVYVAAN